MWRVEPTEFNFDDGETYSAIVHHFAHQKALALMIPVGFDGANVDIEVSIDSGVTFYSATGIPVAGGAYVPIDPPLPLPFNSSVRIESDVAMTADRVVYLVGEIGDEVGF